MDIAETNEPDLHRRFDGVRRLYGEPGAQALAAAHVMVAGIGGVGSWCVEALARSGVGRLTLIDLDHVSESNINRQLHALGATLGMSKVEAMAARVRDINPACVLELIDDFVEPDNVAALLASRPDVLLDCTDQASAKIAMILAAREQGVALVVCGGAGGKTSALALRAGDLARAVNDPLLARLRATLRRQHGYPRADAAQGRKRAPAPRMGVRVLWVDQPMPTAGRQESGGLSCAGYGSAVAVTASMGMAAAGEALHWITTGRFAA